MQQRMIVGLFVLGASLAAQAAPRHQRVIEVAAAGPNAVEVDVTLLAGAARDLRDLRLVDREGREIPYLLIAPRRRDPEWVSTRVIPIASTKTTSGFEADLGSPLAIDRVKLDGIAAPYLKRVRVEGSGDRTRWVMLADATVFDLPDETLKRNEVAFAPETCRYVRFTWDDRNSAPVRTRPGVTARRHDIGAAAEPARVSVPFAVRPSEPGKSRYHVTLPGPGLPLTAIEIIVASGDVFRNASVTEPRMGNGEIVPRTLGSGQLRRAERADGVAAETRVRIESPQGRDLDVIVDDGSNPPLAIEAMVAELAPQPWIYFESPDGQPVTARYGDPRMTAPRYDLEARRDSIERAGVASAEWKDATVTASVPPRSPSVSIPPGAELDRSQFRISRSLAPAPAGLATLTLDADVLARSRALADVRIVDAQNRQIPYIVERRDEPLVLEVPVPAATRDGSTSIFSLALPYESLPAGTRLVLRTDQRVFQRDVALRLPMDPDRSRERVTIAHAAWRSTDPELAPPALTFDGELARGRALEVAIDDGDNAPLRIRSAQLMLPSHALRFHNPGGALALLYGNPTMSAPRYDIELIADRMRYEDARPVSFRASSAPVEPAADRTDRTIFWIAIAVATAGLLALLARVLRTPTAV